ncbi:MAG: hypothetical protein ABIG44_17670 [Planctomycetota bacterium]
MTEQPDEPYEESFERYQEARELMEQGQFRPAIDMFARSFHLAPHAKTAELLGECHAKLGELTDAVMGLAAATTLGRSGRAPFLLAEILV